MQNVARELFTKTKLAMNAADLLEDRMESKLGANTQQQQQQPTVVQHEGWLLKRGAGFKEASDARASAANSLAEEQETSVFANSSTSAATSSAISGVRSRLNTLVNSRFRGQEEKKRYFVLLTTKASTGMRGGQGAQEPRAEIRYFKNKPSPPDNFSNYKGIIPLTSTMEVALEETSIRLYTADRTYFLKVDGEDMNPARARTSAAQWINAIRYAVDGLANARQQKRQTGGRFQPVNAAGEMDLAAAEEEQSVVTLPPEFETRRRARKSVGKRGEEKDDAQLSADAARTNAFVELWELYGLEAFDAVINHFGPVQTDLDRLLAHFTARVSQFATQVQILEQHLTFSSEVVAKEQKTIAYALRELHKTNQRSLSLAKEAMQDMQRDVVREIEKLVQDIRTKLDTIVSKHEPSVTYVRGAKKVLKEADDRVNRLAAAVALSSSSSAAQRKQAGESVTSPKAAAIGGGAGNRRKSEASPDKLEFDLNEARQARRDAAQMLVVVESKCAEALTEAMTSCYELEVFRFKRALDILEQAAEIESTLQRKLEEEGPLEQALGQIDAPRDMRSTFARLKAKGEKTRPNGRMRRKTSTVNLALMNLMEEEDGEDGDGGGGEALQL